MWRGGLLGGTCGGGCEGESTVRGQSGGGAANGFSVHIHCELEAGPQEHACAVDIGVYGRAFATLEFKGEVLGQPHAEKDAEAVV